jgi:hypothetical protein
LDNVDPDLAGVRGMGYEIGAGLSGENRSRFYTIDNPTVMTIC